ncbi:ATP-binding cassette domain-containing protein [Vulcanisaeta sp. JCM 16159]|uniref:ATP-binding cassette domain-containing protein n=1 Tax=Vulcanisaeta sp. JCM 16159 TaxID=1295371 RepID=UPI0006D06C6D|nr:ATP-binding cassette domain-containing protein [Vulcanisaeta sp. JCM 16159]
MLITRLNIKGFNGVNVNIETGPLTVITGPPGSGKSMIIELLWRVFRGIRDRVILEDLSRVGEARVEITISLDDRVKRKLEEVGYSGDNISISVGFDDGYVSAVRVGEREVMVVELRNGVSRVKYPLDVEVADASVLLNPDGLTPKGQALQLVSSASEDYDTALTVIKVLREYLSSVGVYRMGPYIDFRGRVKNVNASYTDFIGEHGEHVVEVLSQLFTDPRRDQDVRFLRKIFSELGFRNFRAGWYGGDLVLSYIDRRGLVHIGDELPCHMKTILALTTQLLVARKPSLILIENADFCLGEGLGNIITKLLSNYIDGKQLIMEVRNKWFIDELKMPHVVLYSVA